MRPPSATARPGLLQGEEGASRVDGKGAVELLLREVERGDADDLDARVGDGDVDLSEGTASLLEEPPDLSDAGHVGLDCDSLAARALDGGDDFLGRLRARSVVDDDAGTKPAVTLRNGTSQAATCPRHQRDFSR
jgi:hypothetical protein